MILALRNVLTTIACLTVVSAMNIGNQIHRFIVHPQAGADMTTSEGLVVAVALNMPVAGLGGTTANMKITATAMGN
jgi:hypothetical protein